MNNRNGINNNTQNRVRDINKIAEIKVDTKDINLYNRSKDSVHLPSVDGYPLYKRVNNVNDRYKNIDNIYENESRSSKWKTEVESTYNSPRNIRRIFLGVNSTVVHFYKPIYKVTSGGNRDTSCIKKTTFSTQITIEDFINSIKNEKNIPIRIKGEKTGISALTDWAIRNVEEIYVDWTGIATNAYKNEALAVVKNKGIRISEDVRVLFYRELGIEGGRDKSNIPNWKKKYPRLKVVGLVTNLDKAYELSNFKPGTDSIQDMLKTWCDEPIVTKMAQDGECALALYRFRPANIKIPESEFSCDSGLYVYDKDILEPYAIELKRRIDRYAIELNKNTELKTTKASNEVTEKGDLEKAYALIMKNSPDPKREIDNMNRILMANDKEKFLKTIETFTEEGKEKYFRKELNNNGSK